jgi:hypothetical protein
MYLLLPSGIWFIYFLLHLVHLLPLVTGATTSFFIRSSASFCILRTCFLWYLGQILSLVSGAHTSSYIWCTCSVCYPAHTVYFLLYQVHLCSLVSGVPIISNIYTIVVRLLHLVSGIWYLVYLLPQVYNSSTPILTLVLGAPTYSCLWCAYYLLCPVHVLPYVFGAPTSSCTS